MDGQTDGQTDGGDCNIHDAFLKKPGDKYEYFRVFWSLSFAIIQGTL